MKNALDEYGEFLSLEYARNVKRFVLGRLYLYNMHIETRRHVKTVECWMVPAIIIITARAGILYLLINTCMCDQFH